MTATNIDTQDRFEFGKNWSDFLSKVDEKRIGLATESLAQKIGHQALKNKKILDIGSGSGLFSLAAHRLGADVISIDFDINCVECTKTLKKEFANNPPNWKILQGSVLDKNLMESLGTFDGVYSWGVLHHTGNLADALENASQRVKPDGWFFISIYNDQGTPSRIWLKIKQFYNKLPQPIRPVYVCIVAAYQELKLVMKRLITLQNPLPKNDEIKSRGMSIWYDWVDWIGGLPFEVAKPEDIIQPLRDKGFLLDRLETVGSGWGCNEYVFHLDTAKEQLGLEKSNVKELG